jgi:hypothetical protein
MVFRVACFKQAIVKRSAFCILAVLECIMSSYSFTQLTNYVSQVPSIKPGIATGVSDHGIWWIKFQIDIEHPLAWRVVQELAFVANYLSVDERLPTVFYPVSPPSYLNGGPGEFLSWVMESEQIDFLPDMLKEWLEVKLPYPVSELDSWLIDDE